MSIWQITAQTTSQSHQSDFQRCTHCGIDLPPVAAFCRNCGARIEKPVQHAKDLLTLARDVDLERYRIISLIQRAPYTQLSLGVDTQQRRPVAIRDIDIQQIDISSHSYILKALQQEYDILRHNNSNDVLPLVDSFYAQNHLYSISTWPLSTLPHKSKNEAMPRIHTLEDLLQSGIGLPDKQTVLYWMIRLARAVEFLHRNKIVIGTLDPSTILFSQKDYSGHPTLFPSWILPAVQSQMQHVLNHVDAPHLFHMLADRTAFLSPEAKQGQPEIRSDIYSMGAILYLLVTGIAPAEQNITASQPLRSPRKINPRIQNTLATIILKALSREPSARFQSVSEFVTALQWQQEQSKAPQHPYYALFGHNRSIEKARTHLVKITLSSDKDNNKTEQDKVTQTDLETIDDTMRVAPHRLTRYYLSHISTQKLGPERLNSDHEDSMLKNTHPEQIIQETKERTEHVQIENPATVLEDVSASEDGTPLQDKSDNTASSSQDEQAEPSSDHSTTISSESDVEPLPITELIPPNDTTTQVPTESTDTSSAESNSSAPSLTLLPSADSEQNNLYHAKKPGLFSSLIERIKRFILGGQPCVNNAVAMIETPMRIQPNTNYTIRIHIMGRNEPKRVSGSKQSNSAAKLGGLGSLKHGELVHIEVRSALYHNYAYIVQQTDVAVPLHSYAAEVTIPMRSITDRSGTRRERLHIFFTDEKHNPLYEEPFLIELFISNLVQSGHEGHNVLSIPL